MQKLLESDESMKIVSEWLGIEEMTIPVNLVKSRKGGVAIIFIPLVYPF